MAERDVLSDDRIQDYIDDRLGERDRAAVAAYLLAHPKLAEEVEVLRRQSEALKGVGQEILDERVPERLRAALVRPNVVRLDEVRRARVSPFVEAAAAILLFCVGGGVGWFVHDQLTPRLGVDDLIATDLASAFAFYAEQRDYPIDFPPDRTDDLLARIGQSFDHEIGPPDLSEFGYEYQGGRLLPAAGRRTGLFRFDGPDDALIGIFFWAAERPPKSIVDATRQPHVSARYWFGDGLSFAVIGDEANPDLERIADTVFSFYESSFAGS